MGQAREGKGENGDSPKGPESPRLSWKAMPSFSSSSMIQLSSSEVLDAGRGREEGGHRPSFRQGRGSTAAPSCLSPILPVHSLGPVTPRPRLTEIPELGIELVSQRPKDQTQLL